MDITQDKTRLDISPVLIFALTLFSSATLMFSLQPMFGKALLPLLGGSASVWNTCMVFYQSILFLGYFYAHWLSSYFSLKKQLLIHAVLIFISLYFLPVAIPENSIPPTAANPSIWLLKTLSIAIGLPFFVLSATSPLLQKWFSNIGHATSNDPYYLSIASNSGSLLALISYPFLLEPELGLTQQQLYWSAGFLILAAFIILCMRQLKGHTRQPEIAEKIVNLAAKKPGIKLQMKWVLLAFIPSSLLLGTTNYISIDIATVPLLWVIPLALYLLSFIIVFSKYNTVIHKKIIIIQPLLVAVFLAYYFSYFKLQPFTIELFFHLLVFFISIMVCHGELAKKRPVPIYLTRYYLIMSFGGMLGGVFNSFVAPYIFSSIHEYPLVIVLALLVNPINKRLRLYLRKYVANFIFFSYLSTFATVSYFNARQFDSPLLIVLILIVAASTISYFFSHKKSLYIPLFALLVVSCATPEKGNGDLLLHQSRNFYGVLSVKKNRNVTVDGRTFTLHEIYSGSTKHGTQIVNDPALLCTPNGYYSQHGPLGSLFLNFDDINKDWQVGVVGLGAGEMLGYAKTSQNWTFFELDPAVIEIAKNPDYFNFLNRCASNYNIQLGDARITLAQQQQKFDLLVIDAFTSDAIPTHLLTREALELYFSKLNNQGVLVFHISNRYLALKKVLSEHAEKLGLVALIQEFRPKQRNPLVFKSDWVVLARNAQILKPLITGNVGKKWQWQKIPQYRGVRNWTDDFTSITTVWK